MNFSYETITTMCALLGAVLSLMGFVLSQLAKSKNKKAKTIAESMLSVVNACSKAVEITEQYVNFTGEEKKAYAMTLVKEYCIDNGIKINVDEISNNIENIITLSKIVNAKKQNGDIQNG